MKKLIFITSITILGIVLLLTGCASAIRYDGPYEGRVIDADTGEPIEGVVVLGVWNTETPTPAGAVHHYYDATETVTDRNGDFKIKGLGLLVLSDVIPMDVLIFKAGYEYLGLGPWSGLKKSYLTSKKIKWDGEKAIIPLKKLTMEERRKNVPPLPPGEAPYEKIKRMLEEYNKNSRELGLGIIDMWRDMR
jgi:hypothetical protein